MRYYLGYDYELLNNHEYAKEYYWQAIDMYRHLHEVGLMSGELKAIRRLCNLLNKEDQRVGWVTIK